MDTSKEGLSEEPRRLESVHINSLPLEELNLDWCELVLEYLDSMSRIPDDNSTTLDQMNAQEQKELNQAIPSKDINLTPRGMIEDYIALSKKFEQTLTAYEIHEASRRGEIAELEILKRTFGSLKELETASIKLEMIIALQVADEQHKPTTVEYENSPESLLHKLGIKFSIQKIERYFGSVKDFFVSAGILKGVNQKEDPILLQAIKAADKTARKVSKYCETIDEFVGIKECSMDQLKEHFVGFLGNNKEYKEKIVRLCVVNYEDEVLSLFKKFNRTYKPETLVDVLYQLCVEVNTDLEIHQVTIPQATSERKQVKPTSINIEAVRTKVLDQDGPIDIVQKKLKSAFAGFKDPNKPLGAFLFVGKTGVGKTELAKAISEVGFNSKIVRVDCSEYASSHEIAKLFGAPPGYIGHSNGGYLTNALIENPDSVVLFDELEKAHPNFRNTMLQILDDGHLRDGSGKLAKFNRALIIATSNAGVEDLLAAQNPTGFGAGNVKPLRGQEVYQVVEAGLRQHFSPEFLNRFTAIVPFNDLDKSTIVKISELTLAKVAGYSPVKIEYTPRVAEEIAELAYNPNFQAREVQRTVDREITSAIADIISENELRPYHLISVEVSPSRKFTFTVKRDAFSHFSVK